MPTDLLTGQLENDSATTAPVTQQQPVDLLQQQGMAPQQQAISNTVSGQHAPFYQRVLPDIASGLLNTAQGINNFQTNAIVNPIRRALGYPGNWQTPQYNWNQTLGAGNTLGDQLVQGTAAYAPFAPLADVAPATGAITSGLESAAPVAGNFARNIANYLMQSPRLSGAINQTAPMSMFGATQNATDPTQGAIQGAEMGFGATAIPGGIGSVYSKIKSAISPGAYADQFLAHIGNGNSLQDNAKSLATDIRNAFQTQKENASDLYNPIFDNYSSANIYDSVNLPTAKYPALPDKYTENYTPDINDLHQAFVDNPTLQNAHNLQSQLGSEIRNYQNMYAKGTLSTADRINMQNYQRAQNAVLDDTNNYLNAQQPGLGDKYQEANAYYATNVAPYMSHPTLSKIATGEVDYPKNINTIFAKPTPQIQKVVQDIGPQANNKILYNQLATPQNSSTPEKLQNALQNLDKTGLGSYVTPETQSFIDGLKNKLTNKNVALHIGGIIAGGLATHPFSETVPGLGEIIGGMVGNKILPPLVRGAQNYLPIKPVAGAISGTYQNLYPPLSRALMANSLGGNQNGGS